MIFSDPRERKRFLRFSVVGAIGAMVDFGTFNILISFFHVIPVAASVVSFLAAISSNFTWNHFWTYPDSRLKPIVQKMWQFALVNAVGLSIRTPIFVFLESRLTDRIAAAGLASRSQFLGHNLALAVAVGVVLLWNFFVNRYWTYSDVDVKF